MTESAPYPIRPIAEDEWDRFDEVDQHAFNTSPMSEGDRRMVLDRFEFDRSLAAFDGTTPVGITMWFSFRLSVPGREVLPAAGVTFVAVLPTHRRRGVLSSMMRRRRAPCSLGGVAPQAKICRWGDASGKGGCLPRRSGKDIPDPPLPDIGGPGG